VSSCEKCWSDAGREAYFNGSSQTEMYELLLKERIDHPCSPKEQAGQFWDEEKKCDSRFVRRKGDE